MPHFLVLYYVAVIMLGLAALAVSVVGTIRSRVASYWLLILFYGAFTASIAALFVREYLYVNIAGFSLRAVLMSYSPALSDRSVRGRNHPLLPPGVHRPLPEASRCPGGGCRAALRGRIPLARCGSLEASGTCSSATCR